MKRLLLYFFPILTFTDCNPAEQKVAVSDGNALTEQKNTASDTSGLDFKTQKFRQGIEFIASGNEPFWSLEIDFDKFMHFRTPDGLEITTPVPDAVKAAGANIIRYSSKTEQGSLTAEFTARECINDMSGEKSDYTVVINVKYNNDKEFRAYQGCGQYLSDYRLHDIWVLESINNKLTPVDFMKGPPQLEFNLTGKKVFGHTGCNNLNGSIEVIGNKIRFGRIITTRMACGNVEFESMYLRKLASHTIPYTLEPGKLHLEVTKDSVFTYKKID